MLAAGMNEQALADALGISRERVNPHLTGRRGVSPRTAERYAAVLGCDPATLVTDRRRLESRASDLARIAALEERVAALEAQQPDAQESQDADG